MAKSKIIHTSGKRKTAVARATLKPGTGKITMNGRSLDTWGTDLLRMRVREPLILAAKHAGNIDIRVNVIGGGVTGQADAARLAIGRALVQLDEKLQPVFLDYDRMLLVADVRRKEPSKPNSHGSARSKKQKSYR
jgi:small subunit ribosomal protein S9